MKKHFKQEKCERFMLMYFKLRFPSDYAGWMGEISYAYLEKWKKEKNNEKKEKYFAMYETFKQETEKYKKIAQKKSYRGVYF